jgi:Phage integrase family
MCRPRTWLFPGDKPNQPVSFGNMQRRFSPARKRAGLTKRCSMHTLRHSYATHLVEAGVDVFTLKDLMGHRSLHTTALYLHLSTQRLQQTPSLLDLLAVPRSPRTTTGVLALPGYLEFPAGRPGRGAIRSRSWLVRARLRGIQPTHPAAAANLTYCLDPAVDPVVRRLGDGADVPDLSSQRSCRRPRRCRTSSWSTCARRATSA